MKKINAISGASFAALAFGLSAPPAVAQSQPASPEVTEDAAKPNEPDIVVTAQRREQRLQEAPVAVTALSNSALEQLNIRDTRDLMTVVPSLQVSTQSGGDSGGSATFFLRGLGQQRAANGSEPAVGIYVDDFYYPSLSGNIFDVVDLASVEVLRGPQGTLFGRNTIGGAIRYTTKRPELGKFSGHITGTIGERKHYDVSGAVNVPIGGVAAIRLTGGHLEQDGFVKVFTTGKNAGGTTTDLIRGQLRVEPTNTVSIDLSGQYSRFYLDGFSYNVPGPVTPLSPAVTRKAPTLPFIYNTAIVPRTPGLPLYNDTFKSSCYYCQYGTQFPEFSETKYYNALATVKWEFAPGLTLKSLSGWQRVKTRLSSDLDSSPAPIFNGGLLVSRTEAFSQELQLNGKLLDGRLNFVAGGYYYNERSPGLLPERRNVVLGRQTSPTPTTRKLKSYAGFIDGSYKLTDTLSLLGGFRYSEDHKSIFVADANFVPITSKFATYPSKTFRVGLQQQWTRDIMTYANVSTGFRGGGFNPYIRGAIPDITPFEPEKATSYEAGARMQFLDRRITINPTLFYVKWNNIQVQNVIINQLTGNADITLQNAGKARSYGAELEWSVAPIDHLRLFGNFAYLNIHYTDVGRANAITINSEFQRAPAFTFAVGAAHTIDLGSGAKIVSTVNYSFQDDQASTAGDADKLALPAYGLVNGRIQFTAADQRFSLAAYVTNLLDKKYAIGGVNYFANVGAARYDLGRPREFGVTARVNF